MKSYFLLFFLSVYTVLGFAQPDLQLLQLTNNFSRPVDIANDGLEANRLYVVEQPGKIKIIEDDGNGNWTIASTPFLDLSDTISGGSSGEMGLLGLVFHPDYPDSNYCFVNYTYAVGNNRYTRISRFEVANDTAIRASELEIISFFQPYGNHNGGDMSFGPGDGYLYIGSGDGGSGGDPQDNAQDSLSLLGKMLRIDVKNKAAGQEYAIPADNPFVNNPDVRDEIWSIGLRNPWRFSFDRSTHDMYIADVGQQKWEEVHWQPGTSTGGENYGWDCLEGSHDFNNSAPNCGNDSIYKLPIFEYDHETGRSVTGGFVYRGSDYPSMQGYYILADFATGKFWSLLKNGTDWQANQKFIIGKITTFGEDVAGELYAARLNGQLYKVASAGALPVQLVSFEGFAQKKENILKWTTSAETFSSHFEVERSSSKAYFQSIGRVEAQGESQNLRTYAFKDTKPLSEINYYRLKRVDIDGYVEYSEIISISRKQARKIQVFPNPAQTFVQISLPEQSNKAVRIQISDLAGRVIRSINLNKADTPYKLSLQDLSEGTYLLEIWNGSEKESQKLVIQR